jgi:hypothetical protein
VLNFAFCRFDLDKNFWRKYKMNIKPLFDKVVIEQVEAEEKTLGGIILRTSDQEKPQMAKIIAVGPGGVIKLYIPAELAYGARGAGRDIGPNEALEFEVAVISVEPYIPLDTEVPGDETPAEAK